MLRNALLRNWLGCFLLIASVSASQAADTSHQLSFKVSSGPTHTLSVGEIERVVGSETIEFFDPHHGKTKRYRGWKLREVLRLAFGEELDRDDLSDAVFLALDGYASVATKDKLLEEGGYVVFEDVDTTDGWEPIGRHRADPGPFYLVWTQADQNTAAGFPWPWQLASIALVTFEERFPKVVPQNLTVASPAYKGYQTFKERCVRCHAINGQGGKVGPDLNEPRNILEYRSASTVRAFIKNASQFRHSRMPPHQDLDARALDNLLDYLWHMRRRDVER
jgi:mono/diheme cytochrome c family protein